MPAPPERVERILVVDDHADTSDLVADVLSLNGYVVSAHVTAESALRAVADFAPDVAFVDFEMPDLDGAELIRALRRTGWTQLRIAVVTGRASPEDRRAAMAAGADAYLVKPAPLAVLIGFIEGTDRASSE
jgi:two-component system, OmpR family, response regulator